jgi:hypothetical protein
MTPSFHVRTFVVGEHTGRMPEFIDLFWRVIGVVSQLPKVVNFTPRPSAVVQSPV